MKTISDPALAALTRAEIRVLPDRALLDLPDQLDRKTYVEVAQAIKTMGGAWNKKAKTHWFPEDPTDDLEQMVALGGYVDVKKDLQQFDTPPAIVERVIEEARIGPKDHVLEPSAGLGALASGARAKTRLVTCIEIDQKRVQALIDRGYSAITEDFLQVRPSGFYDRVVMNPPFTRGQDVYHVLHAWDFLRPGGRLVAIMSPGFLFRETRPFPSFREWVSGTGAHVEELPDKAFAASGTNVRTVMISVDKPA